MPPLANIDVNTSQDIFDPGEGTGNEDEENENVLVQGLAAELLKLDGRKGKGKRKRSHVDDGGDEGGGENTEGNGDVEESVMGTWKRYGRDFARLGGDPWMKADVVIQRGIMKEIEPDSDDEDAVDEVQENTVEDARLIEGWEIMCKLFPALKETMVKLAPKRALRDVLARQISKGVDSTRSNDTASLKKHVHAYLVTDITAPIAPLSAQKDLRGFHHPATARLLTPLEYPANEQTFTEIRTGVKPVTASLLPRMLYPDDREFDEDDIDTGLCQGQFLARIAKHLLMGPASALKGPGVKKGRRGNASKMGMITMTPHIVAYAAVQGHFAISSATEWTRVDGAFDYKQFYWNIVEMCRGDDGKEILKFMNHQVFGLDAPGPNVETTAASAVTSMDLLLTQRNAKRRRLADEQRLAEEQRQAAEEQQREDELRPQGGSDE